MDMRQETAAAENEVSRKAQELEQILNRYIAGKNRTDQRIRSAEQWWKLRNDMEEDVRTLRDVGYRSTSGWLHNAIVSKHADANAAYPEPIIRAREMGDRAEALKLQSILPVVLKTTGFRKTYSRAMWDKLEYGTGIYRVSWDSQAENGLGEIAIENVNPLNVFWQPGLEDIQKSRYFFEVKLMEEEALREDYPILEGKALGRTVNTVEFHYDDSVQKTGLCTVVDCYRKRRVNGRTVLDYCRFAGGTILYDSAEDPQYAERGWYDHGMYPYVFDVLYPIKGSCCGYGYVDKCRSPQMTIDMLNTAYIRNAVNGASPRYFIRQDGGINEAEFTDLSRDVVHANGNLGDDAVKAISTPTLSGNYVEYLDRVINELRETSGNTETSTGSSSGGVTAASAIAALQEASGKGSRDSTETSYDAFGEIVEMVIELIRQFYSMPRQFRIMGRNGAENYIRYSNEGLAMQRQIGANGEDLGLRKPCFDISVTAQKKDSYTRVSQNELALQLFNLGFFNPQMADQALNVLELMDFDGKDEVVRRISRNGTMREMLVNYMLLALEYAKRTGDTASVQKIEADVQTVTGGQTPTAQAAEQPDMDFSQQESGVTLRAREKANAASQPEGGEVLKSDDGNTLR